MRKWIAVIAVLGVFAACLCGCEGTSTSRQEEVKQFEMGDELSENQPTPTDIDYSLERYNLIRRTYWVNGQREKARALPCELPKPLGYIVLMAGNTVMGRFTVDGKVSSLNSFLTPNNAWRRINSIVQWQYIEMPDVDGSYGENDGGIFFFTTDGNYIEWTGDYLYSDIPFKIENPVVTYNVVG